MFLRRDMEKTLTRYAKFPVVALLGPWQSGKTTLVKKHFKSHAFFYILYAVFMKTLLHKA
jgi:predicted AAA+ superfamily ATPase